MRKIKGVTKLSHRERVALLVDAAIRRDVDWINRAIEQFLSDNQGRISLDKDTGAFSFQNESAAFATIAVEQFLTKLLERFFKKYSQQIKNGRNICRLCDDFSSKYKIPNLRPGVVAFGGIRLPYHRQLLRMVIIAVGNKYHVKETYGRAVKDKIWKMDREDRTDNLKALDSILDDLSELFY